MCTVELPWIHRSGIDTTKLAPPTGGRAPGWNAGLVVAGRGDLNSALPLCAVAAALLIKRRRNLGITGALLFLSIGTPTYAAWAVNVIPIILIIALAVTVRRDR
jgi:hypothetical protein